jgi:Fe-S cluster assembly ATPase SufC
MVEWGPNTSMNHVGGSTISKLAVGDTLYVEVTAGTISFDGNDNFSVAYIG